MQECGICADLYRAQASISSAGALATLREAWWLHIDTDHPAWGLPTDHAPHHHPEGAR